jgi:hypothetical protein
MGRAQSRNRWMRSLILLALFLIMLVTGTARPRPARADNLPLIIGAGVGIFVVVVLTGTWLVYGRKHDRKELFVPEAELPPGAREGGDGVRLAPNCRPTDGQAPLLCW